MGRLFDALYHSPPLSRMFHTSVHCLQRELRDCRTVLDLGCGLDSPLKFVPNITRSVGVEAYAPYLEESRRRGIHTEYRLEDFTTAEFPERGFDAVIMLGVLEHLDRAAGEAVLRKVERTASRKVIVSCPNGYLPQHAMDENPYQVHRSGWTADEMRARGYTVYGMTGWKPLRTENESDHVKEEMAILSTIRFRPKPLWLGISTLTQLITYHLPQHAFEIFCVKTRQP